MLTSSISSDIVSFKQKREHDDVEEYAVSAVQRDAGGCEAPGGAAENHHGVAAFNS